MDCDRESFIELVNQLATLERLIDALEVIKGDAVFDQTVKACHPSVGYGPEENDLVLGVRDGKVTARFEVSDISGGGTGANKERRDLRSLGVLNETQQFVNSWPKERLFLIVSDEFADRISPEPRNDRTLKTRWHHGQLNYDRLPCPANHTVILEVKQADDIPTNLMDAELSIAR